MFVPSLSWQNDRFYIKMAQKCRFSPQEEIVGAPSDVKEQIFTETEVERSGGRTVSERQKLRLRLLLLLLLLPLRLLLLRRLLLLLLLLLRLGFHTNHTHVLWRCGAVRR